MKRQCYQVPEIRDENNNIIQEGTYGRTSPLVTIDNTGVLDYINNNLEALHDALLGDRVYVDSAKDLPNPGDVSVTYITGDSGEVYYYDPATATYTAINQGKEYAEQAEKSSAAAEASEANAKSSASSASTSATSASTSASNAAKAEVAAKTAQAEAEKARDDANSAVTKLTGVMKYAGQVDNYSDLADVTKNKGDVWNIVNADSEHGIKAGDNVAWNGTDWDDLSGTVDLSIYAEKADYQKTITSATANGATITFNHKDGTTSTATVNNVASATAATNDAKGQKIDATYEKIVDASNVRTSLQNSINGLSSSKQDKLTFDSTPTADSPNPVTSGGVKTALDKKADTSSLKTVATSGSYNDLTDRPTIPTVPTKVSAFTNDAGYLTAHQSLSNYYTKTQVDTAISNAIASITDGDSKSY